MTAILKNREAALAAIILAMVAAIGAYAPTFVSIDNIIRVLNDTSILAMLALAQMMVILTRGIDLSTASALALAGMISASLAQHQPDLPVIAFIGLAILVGILLGLINGALIAFVGIPPIVVTLGTLAVYRGMIVVYGGGNQVNASEMGDTFQSFPKLTLFGFSTLFWIMLAVSLAVWVFLTMTRTGRGLYAVGGNPVAARYCGIDLSRQQLLVYTIAGAISGLCGYLWVSRYGVAYSEIASGYELTVIAACVIGGVSIAGGVGTVAGTLLGALFLGVIVNALPVMQVTPFWQMAISGAVILGAVVVNARAEKRGVKLILPEARRAAGAAK
ncbi:ABC transporter permease [Aestuariivirga sp.]|jgi:rhamnose transport system permease protein|uniref:ABC transporter permease n=1 Tax=Aestuariivirga sp. TaxID=2650926 RepID=UPI0037847820